MIPEPKFKLGDSVRITNPCDEDEFGIFKIIGKGFKTDPEEWIYVINAPSGGNGLAWLFRNCEMNAIELLKEISNEKLSYSINECYLEIASKNIHMDFDEERGGLSFL
jgi:hypothetical protein